MNNKSKALLAVVALFSGVANGMGQLKTAIQDNNYVVAQTIVQDISDCLARNLHMAIYQNRPAMVTLLLNAGADKERVLTDEEAEIAGCVHGGDTPLCVASKTRKPSIVDLLLRAGADMNKPDRFGQTPLYIAASLKEDWPECGDPATVKHLIDAALDSRRACVDIINLLLIAGADKSKASGIKHNRTPLSQAKENGFVNAIKRLRYDRTGETPLCVAVSNGDVAGVTTLLQSEVDIERMSSGGETPLCIAAAEGHVQIVDLLLRAGARIDQPGRDGETPLYIACREGHVNVVNCLLQFGANKDRSDSDGLASALAPAARAVYSNGQTPLFIAVHRAGYSRASSPNHLAIIDLLIAAHADVNRPSNDGRTPLHIAVFNEHNDSIQIITKLLSAGANVNLADNKGSTPLHIAAMYDLTAVASVLLRAGALVDHPSNKGKTALHIAIPYNAHGMIRLLLQSGANRNWPDNKRRTPLGVARGGTGADESTISLLLSLGCL